MMKTMADINELSEKEFEDILSVYPNLIERGLTLMGRQVTSYGRRMDLLFEDGQKRQLIVELKVGPIKDKHIGQIMAYEGMLLSADDPSIRIMLVGNRVPPNIQRALDHHGIAWKEISYRELEPYRKARGSNLAEDEMTRTPLALGLKREAKNARISHKVMLININKRFKNARTPEELYEYTRGAWKVGPKRDAVEYIFPVYKGIVRNVYKLKGAWVPAGTTEYEFRDFLTFKGSGRWEFEGREAEEEILKKYVGKSVKEHFPFGSRNPIRYVNVK